jgi:hypothetical protein
VVNGRSLSHSGATAKTAAGAGGEKRTEKEVEPSTMPTIVRSTRRKKISI